ncbi:hypothetical protein [Nostoc sp. ATCC 53789]|uniref:hypothetical protein n=1 Tax=unclassified Nostoc TaxID=2593658 RepID=UPI000DECD4DC|nr:hypothetical protein [Nostoc sp. ATCC 53789]QHG18559.1 hypothetical protein GJB62_22980 [Nostoc sp. ATCC 53789]RCJ30353.1 hypothetical protein A6V25_14715 [Nostoc sp. ATCC 53789]
MPAAGGAIASYTKALEFKNGKSFWRVTKAVDGDCHASKMQHLGHFQKYSIYEITCGIWI